MNPKTVREPAREIPVLREPDVLVAGGGVAGIAAAAAAARAGAKVLLLERWGFLGGTVSAVTLGGFCGVWAVTPDDLIPVVDGLFGELVDRLKQRDAVTAPRRWSQAASLPYDPTSVRLVADEMMAAYGVEVMFHTWVADVAAEDGRVVTVFVENKGDAMRCGRAWSSTVPATATSPHVPARHSSWVRAGSRSSVPACSAWRLWMWIRSAN